MAEEKKTEGTVTDAVIDASKLAAAAAAAASWEGIKKAGVEIDAFNSALMKSNSTLALNEEAARKVNDRLLQLSIANKDVGMTSKEANEIYKELSKTLASRVRKGFDDTAGALLQQTKLWSNLGVETSNTTNFIKLFDTALGSSSNEIIKTGRVLFDFAARTGQDANRVFSDLTKNAGSFFDILDKGEMTKQMLTFQGRARSMGMSMGGLMGMLEKFETIDGAQQAGAKLNATLSSLGGGIDAVKMQAMDYPERMNYIATAIQRVMPRIKGASPRAQRLYMKSLRSSLGMSATDFRKLVQYRPGQMLAEGDLMAGRITGTTAGAERAAAQRAASYKELQDAISDAINKGLARGVAQAAGISAPEAAEQFKLKTLATTTAVIDLTAKLGKFTDDFGTTVLSKLGLLGKIKELGDYLAGLQKQQMVD